jgi:hypothetical protein
MVVMQELSDCDTANHSMVAEHLIRILSDNVINLMTDEAYFNLSGCFNKSYHCWAQEDPQQLHQRPLHNARVTASCGVANFGVIAPYFFEDEDGRALTFTSAHYVEMLRNFLTPELSHCGIELSTIWFQQDGATSDTVKAYMEVVWEMFLEHIISLCSNIPWPAYLPDLSAC